MTLTTIAVLSGPLLLVPLGAALLRARAADSGLLAAAPGRGPAAIPADRGQNPPATASPDDGAQTPSFWPHTPRGHLRRRPSTAARSRSARPLPAKEAHARTGFWPHRPSAHLRRRPSTAARTGWLALGAAAAVLGALLPTGVAAGVAAAGWLVVTGSVFADEVWRWWWAGRPLAQVPTVVAWAWLPVAAGWFAASRAGVAPLGFDEPITLLTAAHFHVAGFGLSVLASTTAGRLAGRRAAALAWMAWGLVTLGPVGVAVGFTVDEPKLNMVGAFIVAAGIFALCPCIVVATGRARPAVRRLGRLAAFVPLVPMVLAVVYSLGPVLGTPTPSIELMVRAHGIVNALGFVGLGLASFVLIERRESSTGAEAQEVFHVVVA